MACLQKKYCKEVKVCEGVFPRAIKCNHRF